MFSAALKGAAQPVLLFFTLLSLPSRASNEIHLNTTENQVSFVELFSSENCAKCSQAETSLTALRKQTNLWKTFVPIEFHIDPKNRLGWTDPYTQKQLPIRQSVYASEWGVMSTPFPQFVMNGIDWNGRTMGDALEKKTTKVGVLSVNEIGNYEFEVNFRPVSKAPEWIAYAVLMGNGLTSKDKKQTHDFVALQFVVQAMEKRGDLFWALLQLSHYDLKPVKSLSLAFWVSQINEAKPEQVVGTDMPVASATPTSKKH